MAEVVMVKWTATKLKRFRTLVEAADPEATITFEGHQFLVPYAKYLIEYLEGRLNA